MPAWDGPGLYVSKNTRSPTRGDETAFVAFHIDSTVLGMDIPTLL